MKVLIFLTIISLAFGYYRYDPNDCCVDQYWETDAPSDSTVVVPVNFEQTFVSSFDSYLNYFVFSVDFPDRKRTLTEEKTTLLSWTATVYDQYRNVLDSVTTTAPNDGNLKQITFEFDFPYITTELIHINVTGSAASVLLAYFDYGYSSYDNVNGNPDNVWFAAQMDCWWCDKRVAATKKDVSPDPYAAYRDRFRLDVGPKDVAPRKRFVDANRKNICIP